MQGHVAPGDYDGRFQGSSSMPLDDAAFGMGVGLCSSGCPLGNKATLRIAAYSRVRAFSSLIAYAWSKELA